MSWVGGMRRMSLNACLVGCIVCGGVALVGCLGVALVVPLLVVRL